MAFVTIQTLTIDGDALLHQREDPDGGHRIVVNGVVGAAVAFARIAVNGEYRATVVEGRDFAALDLPSTGLFKAQVASAGGLPTDDVIITCGGAPDAGGGGRSLSFCDGVISRGWGTINAAGGGTTDDAFDIGGGPDGPTLAAAIKTQLDASALDVTVVVVASVATVSPGATGLLVSTSDPGAFALT